MESSTVLAFRIFVMLSCLIIVPLAAIFGSQFPDVVKTVLVDRIVALGNSKQQTATSPVATAGFQDPAANRAQPRPNTPPGWEAPRWNANGNATAGGWQAPDVRNGQGVIPAGAAGGPAWQDAPMANLAVAAEPPRVPAGGHAPERSAYDPAHGSVYDRGAMSRDAQGHAPPYEAPSTPGNMGLANPLDQPDRFTSMERKLRDYGATYYLLETQGQQGDLYRFHCKMAVGGSSTFTQSFEASDRDPLKAMSKVVEQVENWRFGRPQ